MQRIKTFHPLRIVMGGESEPHLNVGATIEQPGDRASVPLHGSIYERR
jgi:hypothetical protein